MLRSGVSVTSALEILCKQKRSGALHSAVTTVRESVCEGESIAAGMRRSPRCFPAFYTTLVAAGEHAGILDQTLDTVGDQLEAQRALRSRMIRAACYPAVVCCTLGVVMIFLLTWVVPTFEELFTESGVALPWLTRALLSTSRSISRHWLLGVTVLVGSFSVGIWHIQQKQTRAEIIERLIARIPLWRSLVRAKHSSECTALLAALTRVGIPLLESLAMTAQTSQSSLAQAALHRVHGEVNEGHSLSTAFRESSYFPEMLSHLLEVGESSGNLESMLVKASSFYHAEVEQTIDTLKQLVEPVLILMIGTIVGITVLALYLPIFQIGELAGGR